MLTYLILNLVFLIPAALFFYVNRQINRKAFLLTLLILMSLTAVFDNAIIKSGIVDYNDAKLLGFKILDAPIEDFFYTLLAVLVVPVLWQKLRKDKNA